jgi:hypothetical protein
VTIRENFTDPEWTLLREAPQAVAAAVTVVGASGIGGTVKEAFSIASTMVESQSHANELIRALSTKAEVQAANQGLKEKLSQVENPDVETVRMMSLNAVKNALNVLSEKSPGDVAAYKEWISMVAQNVAQAAKEGGFLGFGGERVSQKERELIAELSAVLDLPP